jgi:hypothetical protein
MGLKMQISNNIKKYVPVASGVYLLGWVNLGMVEKYPIASVFVFIVCVVLFILATKELNGPTI